MDEDMSYKPLPPLRTFTVGLSLTGDSIDLSAQIAELRAALQTERERRERAEAILADLATVPMRWNIQQGDYMMLSDEHGYRAYNALRQWEDAQKEQPE